VVGTATYSTGRRHGARARRKRRSLSQPLGHDPLWGRRMKHIMSLLPSLGVWMKLRRGLRFKVAFEPSKSSEGGYTFAVPDSSS
jgi:hypothetical protein